MKHEKDTIISHYRIISSVGKGGMGEVYLAQDTKLNRRAAIKFLAEEFSRDSEKLNRFIQEAQATSALNHPNILTVYGIDSFDDTHYIVTEFIEGETLREVMSEKDAIPLNEILKIGIQTAEALSAAHEAGIAHRDIKPENIMIRKDGYIKVLDFGIAKLTEKQSPELEPEGATAIQVNTTPGMIIGTANYMSPEQAKGQEVDTRTDIFSFGVVLYEMIAGHLPFEGTTPIEKIAAIIHKEPKPFAGSEFPPELKRIIGNALRKNPDERYQTIRDLLTDLKDAKQELEFQDKLEKTISAEKKEPKTEMLKATTVNQLNHTTTNENVNDSISIKRSNIDKVFIGALAILLISAIGFGYWYFSADASGQINSIAVMPFENNSISADSEYLSDGLVESLIYRLSQIDNLKVSPTSSVFRYKGKETDSIGAGNELGVAAVMTGRIAQRGDDLTISVELVDIRSNKTLWGERYNRKMSDLLTTQQEITGEIVQKLKLKLAGEDQKRLQKTYTADNLAYQAYLKGRFHYDKHTKADYEKAIELFTQAITRDPNFALAHVHISKSYLSRASWGFVAPKEDAQKAKDAAQKALAIDPDLAEAHGVAAWLAGSLEWDWRKAESGYKRAIELDPNIAEIHHLYGFNYLLPMGRTKENIVEQKRALELEPLLIINGSHVAAAYMYDGQLDKALEQIETTFNLDPEHTASVYYRGVIYNAKGMYDKAIGLAEKALEKDPLDQNLLEIVGYAYARTGQRRKAEEVIERFGEIAKSRYAVTSSIAPIYVALGEKDKAVAELEKAYELRDPFILQLNIHPYFDDIRDDPRVTAIAKRVGLPERK